MGGEEGETIFKSFSSGTEIAEINSLPGVNRVKGGRLKHDVEEFFLSLGEGV